MRSYLNPLWLAYFFLVPANAEPPAEPNPNTRQSAETASLERLWSDLADADAAKAYRAIWSFVRSPQEAVSFIAAHLQSATPPDAAKIEPGSMTWAVTASPCAKRRTMN